MSNSLEACQACHYSNKTLQAQSSPPGAKGDSPVHTTPGCEGVARGIKWLNVKVGQ